MFRHLARQLAARQAQGTSVEDTVSAMFARHPIEFFEYLEDAWSQRPQQRNNESRLYRPYQAREEPLFHHKRTVQLPRPFEPPLNVPSTVAPAPAVPAQSTAGQAVYEWPHLIYAYFIENTRTLDICRRIVFEFLHGERLGTIEDEQAIQWLRNTEALFFREADSSLIWSATSYIRPNFDATRRNAYYRMFGMDLNHGLGEGSSDSYHKPEVANKDFVPTFEDFLRNVWDAIQNNTNTSGSNPTDRVAISNLAATLHNMLLVRRRGGEFSRVEFVAIAMLSWFHLTVEFNSPIVQELRAQGTSPSQRLGKIAERVGIAASSHAESYFRIADPVERILVVLEGDAFSEANAESNVEVLFNPGPTNNIRIDLETVITQWSNATGRDLKTRRVEDRGTPPPPPSNGVVAPASRQA